MSNKNSSYIKQTAPDVYEFFMDYWKFISRYWNIDDSNEHYFNCLTSDMLYYTRKYENNYFFSNLLFDIYDHCYGHENNGTLEELTEFLRKYWEYMNEIYKDPDAIEEKSSEIKNIYKENHLYITMIEQFVSYKKI